MRLLSTNPLLTNNSLLLPPFNLHRKLNFLPKSPPFHLKPSHPSPPHKPISPISSSSSSSPTATTVPQPPKTSPPHLSNWPQFANRVSGEWDGFGAEFASAGSPVELPENVVPEAFREWEVQLFDWQTQCPTLAKPETPTLSYKLIKLLPTVGCEADAATRYSVEERVVGGPESTASGFGYNLDGCYVAVWGVGEKGLELEHCLVMEDDREVRMRVVMVVKWEEEGRMRLKGIRVFSEFWDGPWRNGEQMGGCAIRESAFALGERVKVGDVVGAWEGRSLGVARVGSDAKSLLHELRVEEPQKTVRDQVGLVALPKNLWCSLKEKGGETWAEAGWLLDPGSAITSRCVFLEDGTLKEMAIARENAVLKDNM